MLLTVKSIQTKSLKVLGVVLTEVNPPALDSIVQNASHMHG